MRQHSGIRPFPRLPFKTPVGLYPGSGVAPGGQQGRPKLMHNGLAARPGGATPGASQPRPFAPANHQQLLAALMQNTAIRR